MNSVKVYGNLPSALQSEARRKQLWRSARLHANAVYGTSDSLSDVELDPIVVNTKMHAENLSNGETLEGTLLSPASACKKGSDGEWVYDSLPVILVRTPYKRQSWISFGTFYAERGYHCLVQDCRGRFGSSGDFFPVAHEVEDGGLTVEWIRKQSWCNGKVAATGISYMGLTALAAAGSPHPPDCILPIVASARLFPILKPQGAIALDLGLRWLYIVLNLQGAAYVGCVGGCQCSFAKLHGDTVSMFIYRQ
jgi:hypothetical protein